MDRSSFQVVPDSCMPQWAAMSQGSKDSDMKHASTSGPPEQPAQRAPAVADAAATARLTLRISAEKARRLRDVARMRGMSVNSLLDEMASLALFEFELVSATRNA
jgi:hypothetical protein